MVKFANIANLLFINIPVRFVAKDKMQIFPSTIQKFTDKAGQILKPWIQYLQQFTQAPPNIINLTVSSSPFSYTAKETGFVYIIGGSVSAINLIRGSISIVVTGSLIPTAVNDTVQVTYSVLPTIKFIPSYGAAVS